MSATTKVTLLVIVGLVVLLAGYYTMTGKGTSPAPANAGDGVPLAPKPGSTTRRPAVDTPLSRGVVQSPVRSAEPPPTRPNPERLAAAPNSTGSPTAVPKPVGEPVPAPGSPLEANPTGAVRVGEAGHESHEDGANGFKPGIVVPPASPSTPTPGSPSPSRPSEPPAASPADTTKPAPLTPGVSPPPSPPATKPLAPPGPRPVQYTVAAGDNMWTIAEKWFGDGSKWDLIAKANPLADPTRLKVGQQLNMPAKDAARPEPAPPPGAGHPASGSEPAARSTYTVVSGDTLHKIARFCYANAAKWEVIYEANKAVIGDDPAALQVGMKLTIPPSSPPAAPPQPR